MKTALLCAALFMAASFKSFAQSSSAGTSNPIYLEKGSLLLGANGTGGFGGSGRTGTRSTFLVSPWAGYLVHHRLVTGLSVTFSNDKFTSKDPSVLPDRGRTNVSPELFARYYLMSGKLKPFAELGAGYNFLKSDGARINNAYLSPSLGLSYWLGKRFALEANYKLKLQKEASRQVDPAADLRFRFGVDVVIN